MGKALTTLADLAPDPRNARRHNPRNVGMIEKALNEVGAARSIVVDENNVVLAGNATIEAAAQAGIERVQVVDADGETLVAVRRSGLTDEQKARLALYDNRTAELAEWDASVLAELAQEMDVSALFSDDELAALLAETAIEAQPEDDDAPAIDETQPTRCQIGDVWRIGPHTIACLDSTEMGNLDRVLAGRKVGMVVADPPYGINVVKNGMVGADFGVAQKGAYAPVANDDSADTAWRASGLLLTEYPSARHIWWGANNYADALHSSSCWLVWDKRGDTGIENTFADCELAWTSMTGLARIYRQLWNGMIREGERDRRVHPTQKPVALFLWLYEKYGASGDLILDPFLGSGPTLKAAHRMGDRAVVGFELSPHYCDHIIEWAEANGLDCERLATLDS